VKVRRERGIEVRGRGGAKLKNKTRGKREDTYLTQEKKQEGTQK
jgi:hypothetical protein